MHNSFDFCGYVSVQLMDRNVLCLLLIYLLQCQQVIVIHWVTRHYGSKRTDPEGGARGRGLFTLA